MKDYDPKEIEKKWQDRWERDGIYHADDSLTKDKYYALIEFPYPSGDGLHVGHPRPYIGLDIISRKRRMEGFNVLYPIGWDAFGLPTENYALKTGKDPRVVTKENSDTFRRQTQSLGVSFDWSREINTTDPKYYKWTQWIFLKFLEKGLAYKANMSINWCPKDKIGLANEEVVDGKCERCGTEVEQKEKEQWMLAITKYADRLHNDLDGVDYPERVKTQQRNWIGRSEGTEIDFKVVGSPSTRLGTSKEQVVKVFTTRADTIFGVTFIAVAGKEEKFTGKYALNPVNGEEIPIWEAEYVMEGVGTGALMGVPAHDERDFEFAKRNNLPIKHVVMPHRPDIPNPHVPGKEEVFRNIIIAVVKNPKTGKFVGLKWKEYPWTTFVIGGIEEGETPEEAAEREIMEESGYKNFKLVRPLGGPIQSEFFAAHKDQNRITNTHCFLFELEDEDRDELVKEEGDLHDVVWLDEEEVKKGRDAITHAEIDIILSQLEGEKAIPEEGILRDSGEFSGLSSKEAREKITKKFGQKKITYKLRDWVFSRQRYWGEPIPVIHCDKCGMIPVPEEDLPVELPVVENYQPTDTGESPLANIDEWVNVSCSKCGGDAKRETDTMPNWAGSSWYFYRYCDDKNDTEFASKDKLKHWMPVDWYNGGMEHTVLHLLYSRFWNKFLYDLELVPTNEPYKKRTSHGLILAKGGEKMSKSLGNVVNPDKIVEQFGADTLRVYEMFMGPFEQAIEWNESSLLGPRRFLEKVWKLKDKRFIENREDIEYEMHKTIKTVTDDIEKMKFNTAISALMIYVNTLMDYPEITQREYETLLKLLAPFAPHITEEIWHGLGHDTFIHLEPWPSYDESKLQFSEVTIAVQVNGKVRATLSVDKSLGEEDVKVRALELPEVKKWLKDEEPKKIIVVSGKIVSIVTRG
jgi:leucyl-tRNA synthetase